MPLRLTDTVPAAAGAVQRALQHAYSRRPGARTAPPSAVPAALHATLPHAVYDLTLDRIAAGAGLEAAILTSYRHLVLGPEGVLGAAELRVGEDHETGQASVQFGPFAAGLATALRAAESLAEIAGASFEVAVLRVSAVHLVALWLKRDAGGDDLLVPLPPAPDGVVAGKPITAAALMEWLRPRAASRLAFRWHP